MNAQTRRYIFIDFDTLIKIKFKKLEKVCDKVFVFISAETLHIPFGLVKEMQKMGSAVKWVEVDSQKVSDLNYHICFLMGKLHEKIHGDVEFAILSDDISFDPIVSFINSTGRSCMRVKQQMGTNQEPLKEEKPSPLSPSLDLKFSSEPKPFTQQEDLNGKLYGEHLPTFCSHIDDAAANALIDETARDTVRRLIRSGNRPAELGTLKHYILIHNQELSILGNVDKVIFRLEDSQEISIKDKEVIYNF